jgi:GT2 family glycosyltransferase
VKKHVKNRIAALLTCHNRKQQTLECLRKLFAQTASELYGLHVILVDDGSNDGTADAVTIMFPEVEIIDGTGNLYWNGGMRVAIARAIEQQHDFYLFLNDDTMIYIGALQSLLVTYSEVKSKTGQESIIVGTTQDPDSGFPTYGGLYRKSWLRRLKFTLVNPAKKSLECETMNCNCVLVPAGIIADIGNLDAEFTHAMGDLDYGLRARKAGYAVWIIPGYAGTCRINTVDGTFQDTNLSFTNRIAKMKSVKGLPFGEWMTFARRHAGPFWIVYAIYPYLRMTVSLILRK